VTYRATAVAAIVAVLVALVLLAGPPHGVGIPGAGVAPPTDPGYAAEDARLVQTGADGQPLYTLDAAVIRQRPDTDRVDLEGVKLAFRDPEGGAWTARAARGQLAEDSDHVRLEGDVHVDGTLPGSTEPAGFLSESIDVDTRAQLVTTSAPVTFVTAGRAINATGMVARLKERRVQLESDVHGSFVP